jgi:hypothetical protein
VRGAFGSAHRRKLGYSRPFGIGYDNGWENLPASLGFTRMHGALSPISAWEGKKMSPCHWTGVVLVILKRYHSYSTSIHAVAEATVSTVAYYSIEDPYHQTPLKTGEGKVRGQYQRRVHVSALRLPWRNQNLNIRLLNPLGNSTIHFPPKGKQAL